MLWQLPPENSKGLSIHQLQLVQRRILLFTFWKKFQRVASAGAAAHVTEEYHLAVRVLGETGVFCISKHKKCLGEPQDIFRKCLPPLEKGNIAGIYVY